MRIGIITLSASNNCGSLLQAYALRKLLEPYGDVEIINFTSIESHKIYDIPRPCNLFKHPRSYLFRTIDRMFRRSETKSYTDFRIKQLNISGREYYTADLYLLKDRFDVIVAGSDQIWNVAMRDFDEAFFCDWSNAKKVAYAPSLGGHDIREAEDSSQYANYIKNFSCLSAREEFGRRCLEEITGRTVKKVLDPTLVIDPMIWKELLGMPYVTGDYIFFYSWAYNDEKLMAIVEEQHEKTGMPVYVIDSRKWTSKKLKGHSFILSKKQGPLAFLNMMYYAKTCYVESFHGMVFAYLFHKNFWLLDFHQDLTKMDLRLRELVELLDMSHRILTPFNSFTVDQNAKISYGANSVLDALRRDSNTFIKEALL